MRPTLYAVFPNADLGWRALQALLERGANESDVSLILPEVKARQPIAAGDKVIATRIPGFGLVLGRGPLSQCMTSGDSDSLQITLMRHLLESGMSRDMVGDYRRNLDSGYALLGLALTAADASAAREVLTRFGAMDLTLSPLSDEVNYTSEQPVPLAESPFAAPEEVGLDTLIPNDEGKQAVSEQPETVIKHRIIEVEEVLEGGRVVQRRETSREDERPR